MNAIQPTPFTPLVADNQAGRTKAQSLTSQILSGLAEEGPLNPKELTLGNSLFLPFRLLARTGAAASAALFGGVIGVGYNTYLAIKERDWKHLRSAGADFLRIILSPVTALVFAVKPDHYVAPTKEANPIDTELKVVGAIAISGLIVIGALAFIAFCIATCGHGLKCLDCLGGTASSAAHVATHAAANAANIASNTGHAIGSGIKQAHNLASHVTHKIVKDAGPFNIGSTSSEKDKDQGLAFQQQVMNQ